jgi:hypothetical protein
MLAANAKNVRQVAHCLISSDHNKVTPIFNSLATPRWAFGERLARETAPALVSTPNPSTRRTLSSAHAPRWVLAGASDLSQDRIRRLRPRRNAGRDDSHGGAAGADPVGSRGRD